MREPGYLQVPFAATGDKATIPNAIQPGGSVSFSQGWGPDYQKDQETDPSAKPIDRSSTNYLMYVITTAIQRYQQETFPEFVDSVANGGTPLPYPKGAIVRWGAGLSALRMSLIDNNTTTPTTLDSESWVDPLPKMTAAIVGTAPAIQTITNGLDLGSVLASLAATLPRGSTSRGIVNATYLTDGMATSTNATSASYSTSSFIRLPYWLSTGGNKQFMIAFGSSIFPSHPTNSTATTNVTFPVAFVGVPNIFVTAAGQPNGNGLGPIAAYNAARGGFMGVMSCNHQPGNFANDVPMHWLAIGQVAGAL